jgi:hypothetical protein
MREPGLCGWRAVQRALLCQGPRNARVAAHLVAQPAAAKPHRGSSCLEEGEHPPIRLLCNPAMSYGTGSIRLHAGAYCVHRHGDQQSRKAKQQTGGSNIHADAKQSCRQVGDSRLCACVVLCVSYKVTYISLGRSLVDSWASWGSTSCCENEHHLLSKSVAAWFSSSSSAQRRPQRTARAASSAATGVALSFYLCSAHLSHLQVAGSHAHLPPLRQAQTVGPHCGQPVSAARALAPPGQPGQVHSPGKGGWGFDELM